MADVRSAGSASSSRSVLEAPPPARSSSPAANARNAVVAVAESGSASADEGEQQRAGSPPYFVSCSDACFCAFCILFVVALSLSFALGIAYVQGVAANAPILPGAANYGSSLSSVLAGSGRQEAMPATRTVNDSFPIR